MPIQDNRSTRIPNLPLGKLVDENGDPTDDELTFRQGLVTSLQQYMGNEGLVMPTLSAADILTVQNHLNSSGQYTCAFGTMIYDSTNYSIRICVPTAPPGNMAPLFKTATLV